MNYTSIPQQINDLKTEINHIATLRNEMAMSGEASYKVRCGTSQLESRVVRIPVASLVEVLYQAETEVTAELTELEELDRTMRRLYPGTEPAKAPSPKAVVDNGLVSQLAAVASPAPGKPAIPKKEARCSDCGERKSNCDCF